MERSLVDNASDRKQVAEGQRIERARAKRYRDALARLANTPDGEVLFEQIAERARFFATSFSRDPMEMAHAEGKRTVGLMFLEDWLLARPDALAVLLQKRATEEKRSNA